MAYLYLFYTHIIVNVSAKVTMTFAKTINSSLFPQKFSFIFPTIFPKMLYFTYRIKCSRKEILQSSAKNKSRKQIFVYIKYPRLKDTDGCFHLHNLIGHWTVAEWAEVIVADFLSLDTVLAYIAHPKLIFCDGPSCSNTCGKLSFSPKKRKEEK